MLIVGQSLTQPPGAPVAVSAAAAAGTVMQSGLPAGPPLTPGKCHPTDVFGGVGVSLGQKLGTAIKASSPELSKK